MPFVRQFCGAPSTYLWQDDAGGVHKIHQNERSKQVSCNPDRVLGSPQFVSKELEKVATNHQVLLDRIPHVQDLQSAWLLFLFCASPRPNCILQMLHPDATREFASQRPHCEEVFGADSAHHDPRANMDSCQNASSDGRLGLRSAQRGRQVSYWANWADVLNMVRSRHPATLKPCSRV